MKRFQISSLSLAVAGAFISLSAGAVTFDQSVTSGTIQGDPSVQIGSQTAPLQMAVNSVGNSLITIDTAAGGNIELFAGQHAMQVAYQGSGAHLGSQNTEKLTLTTVYGSTTAPGASYLTGVNALFGADVKLDAKEIEISVEAGDSMEARGLSLGDEQDNQVKTVIGSSNTESIMITAMGSENSMGVFSLKADTLLQAKKIYIGTNGKYGVLVQNNSQTETAPETHS